MFSAPAVRSRKEIQRGLLKRAFERGGEPEREKMKLLIEWRIAACHHANEQALLDFEDTYNAEAFNQTKQESSRWMNATNFIAHAEGRDERLRFTTYDDYVAALKAQIKADQPAVDRHNKLMDIILNAPQFDLKAIRNSRPGAPIEIDPPQPVLHDRRSDSDPVYQILRDQFGEKKQLGSTKIEEAIIYNGPNKPTFH